MVKVVVLDDDPDLSFLVGTLLRRDGYEVSLWSDPEDAMSDASAWGDADIAVVDYTLSRGVTGMDVLRWARGEAGFTGRTMVITGYSWFKRGDEAGDVDVVLEKIFDVDEFLVSVERLAGR